MYLLNTVLLKLEGNGRINHWRQISLFITQDTEKYVLRTYYGRSMKSLKQQKEFIILEEMFARRDFYILKDQRERDNYEVIELLSIDACGLPFSNFQAPTFDLPVGNELKERLNKSKSLIGIPVRNGQRIYIKIGCESIVSVQAIDTQNNDLNLPESIHESLVRCIRPGVIESAIIEGYFDGENLTLTDIACANGLQLSRTYQERHELMSKLFKKNKTIAIASYFKVDDAIAEESSPMRDPNARYYLVKEANKGFALGNDEHSAFIVPNFYSAFVFIIGPNRALKDHYIIGMAKDRQFINVGMLQSDTPLMTSASIKVNFAGVEGNDQIVNAWVAPENYTFTYDEDCHHKQLDNLSQCWGGTKYT